MNVNGITSGWYPMLDALRPSRSQAMEADSVEVPEETEPQDQLEESPAVDEPEPTEEEQTQELKGVLRLLQEGHFKGVADLRHRINFAEELSGVELPEPSAPKGNGRAYEKFLAIYQGMQEPEDATETLDNPAPIDVVA